MAKLDADTENLKHERVSLDLQKALLGACLHARSCSSIGTLLCSTKASKRRAGPASSP